MDQSQLIALLASLGGLIVFILWGISFRRSFEPQQGEYYVLTFFGKHLFTICINDPGFRWFQTLTYYVLFWPFKIATFKYEWVEEMNYGEYLDKKEIAKVTKNYDVRIEWEPEYKPTELHLEGPPDIKGTPINRTIRILVARKEKMKSLKKIEAYSFAAEFETSDGWRGHRFFTLYLEIKDMSTVISRIHNWQQAASKAFNKEFLRWSKGVTYAELRKTSMENLELVLGKTKGSFVDEINDDLTELGFKIAQVQPGQIYLGLDSRDMLDSQEEKAKAQYRFDATEIDAKGIKVTAEANATAIRTKGTAEADVIEKKGVAEAKNVAAIGTAEVQVLGKKTKVLQDFIKTTTNASVKQIAAKYGKDGIAGLRHAVYVENNGENHDTNVRELTNHLIADEIEKIKGGKDEKVA